MRKRILSGVVAVATVSTVIACSGNKSSSNFQIPPTVDSTNDLVSKVSDARLRSHGASLKLGSDGSFELLDTRNVTNVTHGENENPNARCGLRITGTLQYLPTQITALSSNSYSTKSNVLNVTVQDADVTSVEDESSPSADLTSGVCPRYARSLVAKGALDWSLISYSKDYVLLQMNMNINEYNPDKTQPAFSSYSMSPLGNGDDNNRYFVRPGAEIDVTSQVLSDVTGKFSSNNTLYGDVDLGVNPKLKSLRFINHSCGTADEMDISKVVVDDEGNLRMLATTFRTTKVPVVTDSPIRAQYCSDYNNVLAGAATDGFAISYLAHVCSDANRQSSCTETIMDVAPAAAENGSPGNLGTIFYFNSKGF